MRGFILEGHTPILPRILPPALLLRPLKQQPLRILLHVKLLHLIEYHALPHSLVMQLGQDAVLALNGRVQHLEEVLLRHSQLLDLRVPHPQEMQVIHFLFLFDLHGLYLHINFGRLVVP